MLKFLVEIFLLYLQAPLHHKNIVCEMSTIYYSIVALHVAIDSLWTFSVLLLPVLWDNFPDPKGPLSHQPHDRPSQKLASSHSDGDRESVEEEGQSLWRDVEYGNRQILLQEWVATTAWYD